MTPQPKILVIDDETQIRRLLRVALEAVGWKVFEAGDGTHGLSEVAFLRPDCIILDLGLPDLSGHDVITRLREWSQIPVLVLSVRDEPEEKIQALEAGADDYVTKPFDTRELLARCRTIMRRRENREEAPTFSQGSLLVDYTAHSVRIGSNEIDLTATEFSVLRLLCLNAGKVLTHSHILRSIWGPKAADQRQYLRVYVAALRRKLGNACQIKTEPGIGYRLIDESKYQ